MWIKICGIREVATAQQIAECGVDAIGLNFFERSGRYVVPELAAEIVNRLPRGVEPVGLFVNHSIEQINEIASGCRLRTIQLHGDEPPEVVAALSRFRIIRAFRVGASGLDEVTDYLDACRRLNALPWSCLIDARVEGAYGGTGQTAPWDLVGEGYRTAEWPPLILAGGLHPDNVAAAIKAVHPWGVDVAGGVESAVACKDLAMVRKFVDAARSRDAGDARGQPTRRN
ncbi:MAG: phosphoribosylanthranilate isomerase [Planctomycetaceae bacterium]|nr:phosphoribosylanthranilate isomerase [Planctomycetaceae bacterium]